MGFYNYQSAQNKWAYLQKKRTQEAEAKIKRQQPEEAAKGFVRIDSKESCKDSK